MDGPPYTAPWSVLDCLITFFIAVTLLIVVGAAVVIALRGVLERVYADAIAVVYTSVATAGSVLFWLNVRDPRWIRQLFGIRRFTRKELGIGVVSGIVMFVILILGVGNLLELLIAARGGETPPVQEELQQLVRDPRTSIILLISTGVLAPIAEELFFRGLLYPALRKNLGMWPAVGMSGFAFSIIHFQSNAAGYLLVLLILFPAGMVFARLYEWRGTLWVPIAAHSVFNLIQVTISLVAGEVV